jgi:TIR domain
LTNSWGTGTGLAFKAFLSHRYQSPDVNRYFFRLFSEAAQVQFDVDVGTFAINVTRLERMIRGSDAFIGIYPFQASSDARPSLESLLHESRYFRLELDLAARSGKPAFVVYDRRYGNLLPLPKTTTALEFDSLEITSEGGFPSETLYRDAFGRFCEKVTAWMKYQAPVHQATGTRTAVALVLPTAKHEYTPKSVDVVHERLQAQGYTDLRPVPSPPVLDRDTLVLFQEADFAVADIGDASASAVGYLHGSFVPTMRLLRVPRGQDPAATVAVERTLYGTTEVGYSKDVLRWTDVRSLDRGLEARLATLDSQVERLSTAEEADNYFVEASRRKEAVFLSYSGSDEEIGSRFSAALKKRFQQVFDYRDGESIRPGQPWMDEIFDQLSTSAIGIPLLSKQYLASGNCEHEARAMVARRDNRAMQVIPVKVTSEKLELPAYLEDPQYLRLADDDVKGAVERIVGLVKASAATSAPPASGA